MLLSNATINAGITDVTWGHLARRYIVLITNKLKPIQRNEGLQKARLGTTE